MTTQPTTTDITATAPLFASDIKAFGPRWIKRDAVQTVLLHMSEAISEFEVRKQEQIGILNGWVERKG